MVFHQSAEAVETVLSHRLFGKAIATESVALTPEFRLQ
jgi:hypothetical protein